MSIIIDEKGEKVYKTLGYMAYEDKKQADALNKFLQDRILEIEERMEKNGLLELKGKTGSIRLWFNVGLELRELWKEVRKDFQLPDTFITLFMKAAYDNSKRIKPTSGRADRLRNSHFYYCYLTAGFPWKTVGALGSWGEWSDFLDSKRIRDDPRIINWYVDRKVIGCRNKEKFTRKKWFKKITKLIRNELRHIDTTVLEKNELYERLDKILLNADSK
jgi:hypothetical protein